MPKQSLDDMRQHLIDDIARNKEVITKNNIKVAAYQDGYTARYNTYQREETARVQAQEETARVQSAQWNATLQQWAWPSAAGAILIVVAVQAGRTFRHRESERTKRRALLLLYARTCLPPSTRVQIIDYRGEPALADHDAGEIIPYSVAALTVGDEMSR